LTLPAAYLMELCGEVPMATLATQSRLLLVCFDSETQSNWVLLETGRLPWHDRLSDPGESWLLL